MRTGGNGYVLYNFAPKNSLYTVTHLETQERTFYCVVLFLILFRDSHLGVFIIRPLSSSKPQGKLGEKKTRSKCFKFDSAESKFT